VGTQHGIVIARHMDGVWRETGRALEGHDVTAVISRDGGVLAGTTDGIHRSEDGGVTWQDASTGLDLRHVRWMACHPDIPGRTYAGTEPAGIFYWTDDADHWRRCREVETLRDRYRWFLPYSPEAGCVRGFAFHGERGYAAVEVGGVLRSDDGGEHWSLAPGSSGEATFDVPPAPLVFPDVHSIETHPHSADAVYAATAHGLYRSGDGGVTWSVSHAGSYCRALWVDPADPEHIILSPADSVAHKNGRIERSRDGGQTWTDASDGLDLPWPDRMVERFIPVENGLMAITSDGRLYLSSLPALQWRRIMAETATIQALALYRPR
jgi:photosystem II stability/assembly factor-like uncharacterized protein